MHQLWGMGEGCWVKAATQVWDQEVKTLLISSTLYSRPVKSHYLPWHPKADLSSAEEYLKINLMNFMLWHPSDMERGICVQKFLSLFHNKLLPKQQQIHFHKVNIMVGEGRRCLANKGISKLIKAVEKQYASSLLAFLTCLKDDSGLYWTS